MMSLRPDQHQPTVEHRIHEPVETPVLSLFLGYGAMIPFVLGALAAWIVAGEATDLAVDIVIIWGGAVLTFLAGVRRGLSFRTEGGPRPAQLGVMVWLFGLGLGALVAPWPLVSLILLLAAYASLPVLDLMAAQRGEVPPFFARLRPWQMAIPLVCLLVLVPFTLR